MLYFPKYGDSWPMHVTLSKGQILSFTCKMGEILLVDATRSDSTLGGNKVAQVIQFSSPNIHVMRSFAVLPRSWDIIKMRFQKCFLKSRRLSGQKVVRGKFYWKKNNEARKLSANDPGKTENWSKESTLPHLLRFGRRNEKKSCKTEIICKEND